MHVLIYQLNHLCIVFASTGLKSLRIKLELCGVRHLLQDASLDSSVNEAFLQRQCIMTWDECEGSRFTHYTTHVILHMLHLTRKPYSSQNGKLYTSIHVRAHPVICHTNQVYASHPCLFFVVYPISCSTTPYVFIYILSYLASLPISPSYYTNFMKHYNQSNCRNLPSYLFHHLCAN